MQIWVTKYALTTGIAEYTRNEKWTRLEDFANRMVTVEDPPAPNGVSHFHKDEWHTTKEAALTRAETMRVAKIESLKKQIQKLEKLKFS